MKYSVYDLEVLSHCQDFDTLDKAMEEADYFADDRQHVTGVLADFGDVMDWNPVYITRPIFEIVKRRLVFVGIKPKNPNDAWRITERKWHLLVKNVDMIDHDGGMITCGLCNYFFRDSGYCNDCPIGRTTGAFCANSPFADFCKALDEGDLDKTLDATQREIEFLQEVREKYEQDK